MAGCSKTNMGMNASITSPSLPLAIPEITVFFKKGSSYVCGVDFSSAATWRRRCKDIFNPPLDPGSADSGICIHPPEKVAGSQQTQVNSGRYCSGAFQPIGWPGNLCPSDTFMVRNNRVSHGLKARCSFSNEYHMEVFCATTLYKMNATCSHPGFGIDYDTLSRADTDPSLRVKRSSQIVRLYGDKIRYNPNIRTLNKDNVPISMQYYIDRDLSDNKVVIDDIFIGSLILSYNENNYLSALSNLETYLSSLPSTKILLPTDFSLQLSRAGLKTP